MIQHDADIIGTVAGSGGGFLVPDDFLGYLATDLDYFLLTPTGLDPLALGESLTPCWVRLLPLADRSVRVA